MSEPDNFIKSLQLIYDRTREEFGYSGVRADKVMALVKQDPDKAVRGVEVDRAVRVKPLERLGCGVCEPQGVKCFSVGRLRRMAGTTRTHAQSGKRNT